MNKIIDENKNILQFWPVGSIYMSTNDIDPGNIFGGAWKKIENRFLLGSGFRNSGAIGGSESHTLSLGEMPSHAHTRGTMEIEGQAGVDRGAGLLGNEDDNFYGPFYRGSATTYQADTTKNAGYRLGFRASKSWSGETSYQGGNQAHNNMPPYLVVNIWERTA